MALTTFYSYKDYLYPGHSLARKKEDVCDHCIRLQLIIDNPKSTTAEIENAKMEKELHLSAAISQRRAIKRFTEAYMNRLCLPCQPVNIPDFVNGEDDGETAERERARIGRDVVVVAETEEEKKIITIT